MIMAKVHMSVHHPTRKRGSSGRRLDCSRLEDTSIRNEFRCSLAEKLGKLELIFSGENATDQQWTTISSALHEAAAHSIGYDTKNHQDLFDNNTIRNSLNAMHKAHQATLKKPSSNTARQKWQTARHEVQRTLRTMQNTWWTEKAQEIQSFANKNDMHNFYNAVKSIYGPTNHCITPLKTADRFRVLKDQSSILERWAEHLNTLLNQDSEADHTILDQLPEHLTTLISPRPSWRFCQPSAP